ncbi:MAG: carbon-nitrogen hydrolase family protein [Candidatus Omnitrophica bacterium]|nr:carbon-nitrogen hydrolase family protein [Candidatus Omnitrophota bacterium]
MAGQKIKAACIQMAATSDVEKNLDLAEKMIRRAVKKGARLVCLPEVFHFRGDSSKLNLISGFIPGSITRRFQKLAKEKGIHVLLGSVIERSKRRGKFYNTSVFIDSKGRIMATYRKRHLFEIRRRGMGQIVEAKGGMLRGNKDAVVDIEGICLGLAVCYDIRFPEFLGRLVRKGAEIMLLPSNFVFETGKAHWEVLCRARAIENLCYVVAPNQGGKNPHSGVRSFGRSLIVDPWGRVLARGSLSGNEVLTATLDLGLLRRIRREFPTLKKRFSSSSF